MSPTQETKMRQLNTRVPEPLYQWLEAEAAAEEMTVSEFLRYLVLSAKRKEQS